MGFNVQGQCSCIQRDFKNPDYAFAYTLNNGNIVTRTYSSASAFEETESYLSSTYNELDTSDIIYSKGYIKAYSPLVKADYKDINTFIVSALTAKQLTISILILYQAKLFILMMTEQ